MLLQPETTEGAETGEEPLISVSCIQMVYFVIQGAFFCSQADIFIVIACTGWIIKLNTEIISQCEYHAVVSLWTPVKVAAFCDVNE